MNLCVFFCILFLLFKYNYFGLFKKYEEYQELFIFKIKI